MAERVGAVTFKGNPVTLLGNATSVGQKAPNFTVTANDLKDVGLDQYRGKTLLIASVPSLDTGVCDLETRRFNEEAGKLGDQVAVLTISMDLPFAQKRWCGAAEAKNLTTLSDYKSRSFGDAFGVRIKELGLLTRAVFVVDKNGTIVYQQIVPEVTQHPDYDRAVEAAKAAI